MDTEAKLGGNVPLSYSYGLGLGGRRCGCRVSPWKLSKKQIAVNTSRGSSRYPGGIQPEPAGLGEPFIKKRS